MKNMCASIIALAFAVAPVNARAQSESPTIQALSACVERSTTQQDSVVLTRWLFVAIARHPSLVNLANIPDSERVAANRSMAQLFNRLVLEDCRAETRAAWLADGQPALDAPFRSFGERAMADIMGHADVNAAVAEMSSYFDSEGFAALTAVE